MFGKRANLRTDLPAIDIRKKQEKGFFGGTKWVPASKKEQRQMKAALMEEYPDRLFLDDLKEWNSVQEDELSWIDDIEALDAILDDF